MNNRTTNFNEPPNQTELGKSYRTLTNRTEPLPNHYHMHSKLHEVFSKSFSNDFFCHLLQVDHVRSKNDIQLLWKWFFSDTYIFWKFGRTLLFVYLNQISRLYWSRSFKLENSTKSTKLNKIKQNQFSKWPEKLDQSHSIS